MTVPFDRCSAIARPTVRHHTNSWPQAALVTLALFFAGQFVPPETPIAQFLATPEVEARSTGGRSSSGSFNRSGSGSRSTTGGTTKPTTSNPNSSGTRPTTVKPATSSPPTSRTSPSLAPRNQPNNAVPVNRQTPSGGNTIVPVPVPVPVPINNQPSYPQSDTNYNSQPSYSDSSASRSSGESDLMTGLVILVIALSIFALIIWGIFSMLRNLIRGIVRVIAPQAKSKDRADRELNNNTVTITKLQLALLANARHVQAELTDAVTHADTETDEGRKQHLQEAVLILLRSSEFWTHVLASSQVVSNLNQAQDLFEQISLTERSKFTAETLVNVGGKVRQRQARYYGDDDGPASYIVVTLLVGSAHDRPLFDKLLTRENVKSALVKLNAIPVEYLMVFELLWSPQDATDSLTADELLMEYTEMRSLI